jgi:transcriptional regulator with XRE-family HTH domain
MLPHPTDDLWRHWGKAVSARRRGQGLTQFQLAQAVGVAIGTISDIERGVAGGSDQTKFDIAAQLDCEVGDLFAYPSTKAPAEVAS